MKIRRLFPRGAVLSLALAASGCGGIQSSLPSMQQSNALRALNETGAGKISHIVYIVQENRSFNNMFMGYPGAHTVTTGRTSSGKTVKLKPVSLTAQYDIDHSANAMFAACRGTGQLPGTHCRMDGFDKEQAFGGPKDYPQYVYVPHPESKPYWDMAHEWVLADKMFQSQLDESFVAHQYIIAAQAAWSVNLPSGAWGCSGGSYDIVSTVTKSRGLDGPKIIPCYDYTTLGDELDKAHLSWRFYAAAYGSASSGDGSYWSSYQAVDHIYNGPDWQNV
ncbi:MAG TPA: alkaline phosphatase family protein, partial [Candidatus Cybelea sp.]